MAVSDQVLRETYENAGPVDTGTNWFGYKYLGPGTDVKHHLKYGVQPVDGLDAAAQRHDIAYANISSLLADGKITVREAEKLVDTADWELANRSAVQYLKSPFSVDLLIDAARGNVPGVIKRALRGAPALYTSTVMRGKWLLSKLGIGRGSFANLRRRRRR